MFYCVLLLSLFIFTYTNLIIIIVIIIIVIIIIVIVVGIGGIFVVQCPPRITDRLSSNVNGPRMISIVDSVVPVKLKQCILPEMKTVEDDALTQQAFVYNNCQIKITNVMFDEPVCPGRFCDNVHCYDGGKKISLCSCFEKTVCDNQVVAVLDFDVTTKFGKGDKFPVSWFTSKRTTNYLFKDSGIQPGVRATMLNEFRAKNSCRRAFQSVFSYVNRGGGPINTDISALGTDHRLGWTVVGWVRRGTHDDQALVNAGSRKDQEQTLSGKLVHHVTYLMPTVEGTHLNGIESLRFDSKSVFQGMRTTNGGAGATPSAGASGTASGNQIGGATVSPGGTSVNGPSATSVGHSSDGASASGSSATSAGRQTGNAGSAGGTLADDGGGPTAGASATASVNHIGGASFAPGGTSVVGASAILAGRSSGGASVSGSSATSAGCETGGTGADARGTSASAGGRPSAGESALRRGRSSAGTSNVGGTHEDSRKSSKKARHEHQDPLLEV